MTDAPYIKLRDELANNLKKAMEYASIQQTIERILFCPFVYRRLCSTASQGNTNCTIACSHMPQELLSELEKLLGLGRTEFVLGAFTFRIRPTDVEVGTIAPSPIRCATTLTISFASLRP